MIVSLSGGLDSAVLLATLARGCGVKSLVPVAFDYGSKHNPYELDAAQRVASYYRVLLRVIDLRDATRFLKSSLMADSPDQVPEGHYEDECQKATVVPGRNLLFASVLAGIAESEGHNLVYMGAHAGDQAVYPDCRPEFFTALAAVFKVGTSGRVRVEAPFLNMNKADIVKIGLECGVPFYLTRTCYTSSATACGRCGACRERVEAFAKNNAIDPIHYQLQKE